MLPKEQILCDKSEFPFKKGFFVTESKQEVTKFVSFRKDGQKVCRNPYSF